MSTWKEIKSQKKRRTLHMWWLRMENEWRHSKNENLFVSFFFFGVKTTMMMIVEANASSTSEVNELNFYFSFTVYETEERKFYRLLLLVIIKAGNERTSDVYFQKTRWNKTWIVSTNICASIVNLIDNSNDKYATNQSRNSRGRRESLINWGQVWSY